MQHALTSPSLLGLPSQMFRSMRDMCAPARALLVSPDGQQHGLLRPANAAQVWSVVQVDCGRLRVALQRRHGAVCQLSLQRQASPCYRSACTIRS